MQEYDPTNITVSTKKVPKEYTKSITFPNGSIAWVAAAYSPTHNVIWINGNWIKQCIKDKVKPNLCRELAHETLHMLLHHYISSESCAKLDYIKEI